MSNIWHLESLMPEKNLMKILRETLSHMKKESTTVDVHVPNKFPWLMPAQLAQCMPMHRTCSRVPTTIMQCVELSSQKKIRMQNSVSDDGTACWMQWHGSGSSWYIFGSSPAFVSSCRFLLAAGSSRFLAREAKLTVYSWINNARMHIWPLPICYGILSLSLSLAIRQLQTTEVKGRKLGGQGSFRVDTNCHYSRGPKSQGGNERMMSR